MVDKQDESHQYHCRGGKSNVERRKSCGERPCNTSGTKRLVWRNVVICKFITVGQIFVDLWTVTFSSAKAGMLQPSHRPFVGCAVNTFCYKESWLSMVEMLARQVLNDYFDTFGEPFVHAAANVPPKKAGHCIMLHPDCILLSLSPPTISIFFLTGSTILHCVT